MDTQVLLVEDNETDVLILKDVVSSMNTASLALTHVDTLEAAMNALAERPADVVLLDLNLPDSSGLTTFRQLHARFPLVPVLVLTGLVEDAFGQEAVALGAQDYLNKASLHPNWLWRAIAYAMERQRATGALMESQRQLRDLAQRLQAVREEERSRISRLVHDEIGQAITSIKIDLGWMERRLVPPVADQVVDDLAARVVDAKQSADDALGTVQNLAIDLRPGVLDTLGLADAVLDEASRFGGRSGIACRVEVSPDVSPERGEIATALFRILQELFTNVARHSRATDVQVSLASTDRGTLALIVSDNGIGLKPGTLTARTSLGLLGIRERAAALDGTVSFTRPDAGGTRVEVDIPRSARSLANAHAPHLDR